MNYFVTGLVKSTSCHPSLNILQTEVPNQIVNCGRGNIIKDYSLNTVYPFIFGTRTKFRCRNVGTWIRNGYCIYLREYFPASFQFSMQSFI